MVLQGKTRQSGNNRDVNGVKEVCRLMLEGGLREERKSQRGVTNYEEEEKRGNPSRPEKVGGVSQDPRRSVILTCHGNCVQVFQRKN